MTEVGRLAEPEAEAWDSQCSVAQRWSSSFIESSVLKAILMTVTKLENSYVPKNIKWL